jgi:cell wall-active antibiotic response 4TMS protein YvqF
MNTPSPIQDSQPEPMDRHEARRQRRATRLADRSHGGSWIAGIVLILLGGAFLLQSMGSSIIPLKNWWALFILLPALGTLDAAWRMYQDANHQLTIAASGSLMVGSMLLLIAFAFLFDISWTFFGPVLIILLGLGLVMTNLFGRS